MIALAILLLAQGGAPVAPPPPEDRAALTHAASPRTLSGRFTCEAGVYDVQVTATPSLRPGQSPADVHATLDRLALNGRAVDAGSFAEVARTLARIGDVQSLDIRCRAGGGELSFYGTQPQPDGSIRRARVRGELVGARASGLSFALQR